MLKILQARLQQYMNWEFPGIQAGCWRGRGTRDQIANIHWIIEKAREFQNNLCFIIYAKALDCVDHSKLWKILKEMGVLGHFTCLLRNLHVGQEQQLKPAMKQLFGSKLGKEYAKAIYCHLDYLTYIQSTSCKMPECMKHKLESSFLGEISIISDMQMAPPYVRKQRTKEPLDESEGGGWKIWLKSQHSEN